MTEPYLLEAFEIANTAGMSEEELDVQWKRHDFIYLQKGSLEKARNDGLQEGRQEEKEATAKKMLACGLPIGVIVECTGLNEKEIHQLESLDYV